MKKSAIIRLGMAVGLAAMGLVSCTSMHAPHPTAQENAVMCDKCKTTWIVRSTPGGKSLMSYTRTKVMVCPDCKSAVQNWMETGTLKHSCSHCNGKLTCEKPVQDQRK